MMTSDFAIRVRDLEYGRDHKKLYGPLSFSCSSGETTAILGRNGCGKTTLLLTLAGVLAPLSGSVIHTGDIAWVPQNFHTELQYDVSDIVLMGRSRAVELFSQPKKADEETARQALNELGALSLWQRSFSDLSGGQQQLVMIARALASAAPTLLLDEPTAALDLGRQEAVLQLIMRLRKQNKAVVFSTHDPLHAALVADKSLLLLPDGTFLYGKTADVVTSQHLSMAYGVRMTDAVIEPQGSRIPVPNFSL